MSNRNCGLAPWEVQNGFDERGQRREVLLSRSQWWKLKGRKVIVPDTEATRIVTSKHTGHLLCLFDESQTKEL
jgi:hypothetical protein